MEVVNANEAGAQDLSIPSNPLLPDLPRAPELLFGNTTEEKKLYWDRSHYDSPESQMKALAKSATLYVGNLSFSTRSTQMRSHFWQIGPVKAVHMGLDRFRRTPCGFAFVEYYRRRDAQDAVANLSGTKLDGRVIRVELDAGFKQGRQFGRGASGGQVRDERRKSADPARQKRQSDGGSSGGLKPFGAMVQGTDSQPNQEDAMGSDQPEKNPRFREE